MKTEPRRVEPLVARLSVKIPPDSQPAVDERPPDRPPGTFYTLIARETTDDN
jgi:hypothetical protein